jgi:environmental stress-induced protein Ves
MRLTHLPATGYKTVAWKNGGGQTQEMAVWPPDATMSDFHWRISMATVTGAGAFSVFPSIDRHLTVLEGRLRLETEARWHLLKEGDHLRFEGDANTFGAPVTPKVKDLNVMTRRGRYRATITMIEARTPFTLKSCAGFIFAFDALRFEGMDLAAQDLLRFETRHDVSLAGLDKPVQLIHLIPLRA